MRVALSPCPNDTYLFHAWIEGFVGKDLPAEPVFADIQRLNEWALQKTFPLIKLSFSCFAQVARNYQLLPIGSALGFNCGPKIVAKTSFPLSELTQKRMAIPGKDTTAHFLLTHLLPTPKEKRFCLYHEIGSLIENGIVDCGVIIHESRFTYRQAGFVEIADLGAIWDGQTHLPLPLGGIAIARDLPNPTKKQILTILRDSLTFANSQPDRGFPFILKHSQEKSEQVVHNHIATYITSETESLSTKGIRAIEKLLNCDLPHDWLYPNNLKNWIWADAKTPASDRS